MSCEAQSLSVVDENLYYAQNPRLTGKQTAQTCAKDLIATIERPWGHAQANGRIGLGEGSGAASVGRLRMHVNGHRFSTDLQNAILE
jgi:hypothetical protein